MMHDITSSTRRSSRLRRALVCALLAALVPCLAGAGDPVQEIDATKLAKVQAAYLYNFTKYVRWPDERFGSPSDPLIIGVLGPDPFGSILDATVADKTVHDRSMRVVRLAETDDAARVQAFVRECHVVFVSRLLKGRPDRWLTEAHRHDVLTVSDQANFARQGGMIGLVLEENRIVFEINHDRVRATELKISAKMLNLARIVTDQSAAAPTAGGAARP